jgi:Ion channel
MPALLCHQCELQMSCAYLIIYSLYYNELCARTRLLAVSRCYDNAHCIATLTTPPTATSSTSQLPSLSCISLTQLTFLDSLYLVIVSATTVGYGDAVPKTNFAKAFTILYLPMITLALAKVSYLVNING